jgi:hypothetical protein
MSIDVDAQSIQDLLDIAGVTDFTGRYTPLGGGEGNVTFVLNCGSKLVLRVANIAR